LGEPSTNALVTGRHAAGLLAKQNARREAGFSPRPIRLVARVSHGLVNTRGIADEFNPAHKISGQDSRLPTHPSCRAGLQVI
jgi:hypothetical protein